jgi:hypothetical protein
VRSAQHRLEPGRRSFRRRASAGLVTLGVLSLGGGATGIVAAHAAGSPGSNFGNIDITVTSTGLRAPFYSHTGEDVAGQAPYAFATLQSGGTGSALTSVFWPGGTGGNGGSTLKLLAGGCVPPNPGSTIPIPIPVPIPKLPCLTHTPDLPDPVYQNLNDSYKAEVQSSDNKTTVTKSNPGVDMTATANDKLTSAATVMAGAKLPGVGDTFGTTTTSSSIKLTGPNTAVIDAVSVMRNVKLGGGALSFDSVKSVAHAVTDGKKASGSTGTVVNGMKIAGVPVTVDNKGVHIKGQGSNLPSLDALNSALEKAGFSVYVANPSKKVHGASANLFSGQLIVMQDNPQYTSNANDSAIVMSFGGAGIAADTNRAFQFTPFPPAGAPPAAQQPGTTTTPGVSAPSSSSVPSSPTVASAPQQGAAPILAAAEAKLPGGIAAGWVVMALLGAGLIAAGLKRLPDRVLATSGAACSLGSDQ